MQRVPPKAALVKEMEELRDHLEGFKCRAVFSHNDLLLKNVIYNEKQGTQRASSAAFSSHNDLLLKMSSTMKNKVHRGLQVPRFLLTQ